MSKRLKIFLVSFVFLIATICSAAFSIKIGSTLILILSIGGILFSIQGIWLSIIVSGDL